MHSIIICKILHYINNLYVEWMNTPILEESKVKISIVSDQKYCFRENCFDNFHFASDQSNRIEQYINREYGAEPEFTAQIVVISGILHWNYEVQVYIGK